MAPVGFSVEHSSQACAIARVEEVAFVFIFILSFTPVNYNPGTLPVSMYLVGVVLDSDYVLVVCGSSIIYSGSTNTSKRVLGGLKWGAGPCLTIYNGKPGQVGCECQLSWKALGTSEMKQSVFY